MASLPPLRQQVDAWLADIQAEGPEQAKQIRWGVIGLGDVVERKSGPALQQARGSRIQAVMRRDEDAARAYAERHGVASWYSTAADLVRDPEVDAIYVATPPSSHRELAVLAAQEHKPCLTEKPLARSATETAELLGAFTTAQVPLYAAYYRRALPRFKVLKHVLDAGYIGTPTSVSYRLCRTDHLKDAQDAGWRVDPAVSGGGIFVDIGSHVLDLLDFLFGPLEHVSGSAARAVDASVQTETMVSMSFTVQQGRAVGTALFNFVSAKRDDALVIHGANGKIELAVFDTKPFFVYVDTDPAPTEVSAPSPTFVHQPLIQDIVDELRGVRGLCSATGEAALRTAHALDAVLNDFYGGRQDDFWNRLGSRAL